MEKWKKTKLNSMKCHAYATCAGFYFRHKITKYSFSTKKINKKIKKFVPYALTSYITNNNHRTTCY